MLYALVLSSLLTEFSMTTATGGLLGSLALLASGLGGVLFGAIADRVGRRKAMIASIIVYSVFTAACGLSQTIWHLAVFRFLLGLGMGGEWTSGAVLVSETWPDRHRGKAVALMQSSWAVGYAAAALTVAFVLPNFGWRAVFFVGLLPALVTLWIRRNVEESPVWLQSRSARHEASTATIRDVFRGRFARTTALLTILSTSTIFAYWGLNLWVPAYLSLPPERGGLGLTTSIMTVFVVTMQVGTFFGYVSFGYVADAIGRRTAFVVYILLAAALIACTTRHPCRLINRSSLWDRLLGFRRSHRGDLSHIRSRGRARIYLQRRPHR
jgi:MFS family permease